MPVIKKGETKATKKPIPHEPGEFINFLPVPWTDLEEAEQVQTEKAVARAGSFPEHLASAMFASQAQAPVATDEEDDSPRQKPASAYDRVTLLLAGIESWSYEHPVNEESIKALDEATASWAVDTVLSITRGLTDGGKGSASSSSAT